MGCAKHNTTEKHTKTKPRNVACASCQTSAQTNYKEFTLCHGCSHAEQRCICCGDSVATQGIATQNIGNPVKTLQNSPTNSAWPLFANLGHPVNALQNAGNDIFAFPDPMAPPSQHSSANPFASQNVMATHDVMASENVLASVKMMASQSSFA